MNRRIFLRYLLVSGAFFVSSRMKALAAFGDFINPWRIRTVEGGTPEIDMDKFSLSVTGLVEERRKFAYSDLENLTDTSYREDFNCVEGWNVPDLKWEGVSLNKIIEIVKPYKKAKYINFYCYGNKYTESIPISEVKDRYILALKVNGEKLEPKHGFPVRLFYPDRYGYKSAKWIKKVEFSDIKVPGFWTKRGYSYDGKILG